MRHAKQITILIVILMSVLIFVVFHTTPVDTYMTTLKQMSAEVNQQPEDKQKEPDLHSHDERDPLYQEVKDLAAQIYQPPLNAKMDRVWKAIPGYNGLEVDVQKSYEIAKQMGKVQLEMLYIHEIEPEVSLEELEPTPIYRGNSKKPMISVMVNVAWGTEYVQQMLDVFKHYQVKATFFLDGSWLKKNPQVAKKIHDQGHEIGNHAYSHPDLRKMSVNRIKEEMVRTNELIEEMGAKSYLFAPPSGAYDERVIQIAHQLNMKTIMWTLDTVDWKKPPAPVIVDRIVPRLENGVLILTHPTESTVEALPAIIEEATKQAFMIGTVSEMISPARTISVVSLGDL